MQNHSTGNYFNRTLRQMLKALLWLQTMLWCFVLVGATGLSVYAFFENPEPWASIGKIWIAVGGLTVAVFLLGLVLSGLTTAVNKAARRPTRTAPG